MVDFAYPIHYPVSLMIIELKLNEATCPSKIFVLRVNPIFRMYSYDNGQSKAKALTLL
jgi:hypothetical protein